MRTLRSKYLSDTDIPIEENNYKADFNILEKYQAFSAEILRLSLLGLAIYGFLITNVIFKITNKDTFVFIKPFITNKLLFIVGAVALISAALCALGHRYFSTDCMTHYIRRFRLRKKLTEIKEEKNRTRDNSSKNTVHSEELEDLERLKIKIHEENISFESDLKTCKWLLIYSNILLILGIVLVVSGLGKTLIDALSKF